MGRYSLSQLKGFFKWRLWFIPGRAFRWHHQRRRQPLPQRDEPPTDQEDFRASNAASVEQTWTSHGDSFLAPTCSIYHKQKVGLLYVPRFGGIQSIPAPLNCLMLIQRSTSESLGILLCLGWRVVNRNEEFLSIRSRCQDGRRRNEGLLSPAEVLAENVAKFFGL